MSKRSKKEIKQAGSKIKARIVALITDFGTKDHYVGTMKAVMLSINPEIRFVDITHEIFPQNIKQAGYLLWATYKYFRAGTVFVCIVDPGVGSERRMLGVRTKDYIFLAPDNGLLNFVFATDNVLEEIELDENKFRACLPKQISYTFHGRDIFAPVAAYITKGMAISRFGKIVVPRKIKENLFVDSASSSTQACILHIDTFGNIVTNIQPSATEMLERIESVLIGDKLISSKIRYYYEAPDDVPCMLIGSSGLLEVAVKNDNAARILNVTIDSHVEVYWK